ncbi:MAG TPA: urate hydroxylase PuuD, partial [Candidatus Limnocylindria bacterium]|nr:urate hydroxylase PuuD [Candidatus Limnocylindria bacterium]
MDPVLAYVGDWLHLVIRWAHIVAAIAWVGASFYFIALDRSLRPPTDSSRGVGGEAWEIHGGGFYRIEKFRVAPATLPERLAWFKWEAYLTWLTGFALLVLLYYLGANTYLIDPLVRPLEAWQAIAASLAILAAGWVAYDQAARRFRDGRALVAVICVLIALAAWVSSQLFSPRAAYIQTGALIGTWMAANVFFVIIPGQRRLVAATAAGRTAEAIDGIRGKQRSVHNNYLTLPAVFAMISQHFPFTYGSDQRWLVLLALMACGALAQHALNVRHDGRSGATALAAAFGLLALVAVGLAPLQVAGGAMTAAEFPAVQAVITQRCVACHSVTPTFPGTTVAPKGVVFDTAQQMRAESRR